MVHRRAGSYKEGGSFGASVPRWLSNRQMKIVLAQAQVGMEHEPSGRVCLNHVCMGPIVAALSRSCPVARSVARVGPIAPACTFRSERVAEPAVSLYREHCHGTAEIVGHEEMTSARMHADKGGARTARSHGVEGPAVCRRCD